MLSACVVLSLKFSIKAFDRLWKCDTFWTPVWHCVRSNQNKRAFCECASWSWHPAPARVNDECHIFLELSVEGRLLRLGLRCHALAAMASLVGLRSALQICSTRRRALAKLHWPTERLFSGSRMCYLSYIYIYISYLRPISPWSAAGSKPDPVAAKDVSMELRSLLASCYTCIIDSFSSQVTQPASCVTYACDIDTS